VNTFLRELAHGVRVLRRRPAFTAVVVLTIALGVGATTAVFSLGDWVLLRPLPGTTDADRIVTIELRSPEDRTTGLSSLNLQDLAQTTTSLQSLAGWSMQLVQLSSPDIEPEQLFGEVVGGDFFGTLGVRPRLGRALRADETIPGRPAYVAVISDDLWRRRFERDPDVIGRVVLMNTLPITIVGVASRGFKGGERIGRIDVWLPGSISGEIRHLADPSTLEARSGTMFYTIAGRLADGASAPSVTTQLREFLPRLARAYPEDNEAFATLNPLVFEGVGMSSTTLADLSRAVRILAAVVALVLIIACTNVANMLLVHGVSRSGEAALRRALGASGARLMRQQLAEGMVLAGAGGLAGIVVAFGLHRLFRGTRLNQIELDQVPLDLRVLLFALALAIGTGLLFGLVPTLVSRAGGLTRALRQAGARDTAAGRGVRATLTVVQLSLSLTLLIGAALLSRTLLNYYAIELGFDTNVVAFTIDVQPQAYTPERKRTFEANLFERIRNEPKFQSAALTQTPPFAGFYGIARVIHPVRGDTVQVVSQFISPNYFATLEAEIVAGRGIRDEDLRAGDGPRNVVVSQTLATRLFGDGSALGQTFSLSGRSPGPVHVVGVAADKRVRRLTEEPEDVLYEPFDAPSRLAQYISVIVRSPMSVPETQATLRAIVDGLDPTLPFMYVERLQDKTARALAEQRLFARVVLTLAGLAMLMAAIGLYGVIAHSVAARTREIGIRMALGAQRKAVMALFLRHAGALAAVGVALGVAGAIWLSRLVESRLFGVEALDVTAFIGAALLFLVIALVASAIPTRAAVRVDPVVALRTE
jgi:predicted permease